MELNERHLLKYDVIYCIMYSSHWTLITIKNILNTVGMSKLNSLFFKPLSLMQKLKLQRFVQNIIFCVFMESFLSDGALWIWMRDGGFLQSVSQSWISKVIWAVKYFCSVTSAVSLIPVCCLHTGKTFNTVQWNASGHTCGESLPGPEQCDKGHLLTLKKQRFLFL